ncbi:MAG: hypothetical protein U0264_12105 [Candidatus Kapaibacterium sp.]
MTEMTTTDTTGHTIIDAIESITIQIAELIKSSDTVGESEDLFIGEAIEDLYNRRLELLEQFGDWYYSASGQGEVQAHSAPWNTRIQNLIKADAILVENIRRKMEEAQFRLRTFQQQKSLLIYSNR